MFNWYDGNNINAKFYYPIIPMDEIWIPVSNKVADNLKPYYSVSNYGRIMSNYGNPKFLTVVYDKETGYGFVNCRLTKIQNNHVKPQISLYIHRIILISFSDYYNILPSNYKRLQVNHKDTIKFHNWLWNLEWTTPQENTQHSIKYGNGDFSGEKSPNAKITEADAINIISLINSNKYTYTEIANMYNISISIVSRIANNKTWKHIDRNILPMG